MSRPNDQTPTPAASPPVGPVCRTPDPIGLIAEEHALQLELCDLLESLADGLPHSFDNALAVIAVSILEGSVPRHMRLEEEALFPMLRDRVAADHPLQAALACLEEEHERDGATLVELTDILKSAAQDGCVANADMLGYILRGFFDGQRRHIAWEDRVVLPVARQVLTADDLASLQTWIMASDHPRCSQQSIVAIRNARSQRSPCAGCPSSKPVNNVVPFNAKFF